MPIATMTTMSSTRVNQEEEEGVVDKEEMGRKRENEEFRKVLFADEDILVQDELTLLQDEILLLQDKRDEMMSLLF